MSIITPVSSVPDLGIYIDSDIRMFPGLCWLSDPSDPDARILGDGYADPASPFGRVDGLRFSSDGDAHH